LLAVKLTCANMENASLIKCNFEDPHQQAAVLEGCNLRGANLEGSQMSHVNLRVACLKNACVKNCDLRSAVLAGADLEVIFSFFFIPTPFVCADRNIPYLF
jgi:uncharacterized protein YjbI with pentapeptide repeats